MAETQDTGAAAVPQAADAAATAAPVSTAAAADTATPAVAAVAATPVATVQDDPVVKIASRLNYSVTIEFSDGEVLSLPAHAVRSTHKSNLIDKDGKAIALPKGVVVVGGLQ